MNVLNERDILGLSQRLDPHIFEGKKVLVTGAAGMLGSWLTTAILSVTREFDMQPNIVHGVSRSENPSNLSQIQSYPNFKYIQNNVINNFSETKYDLIIHAASPASPNKYHVASNVVEANVSSIKNLVHMLEPSGHFSFISSGEVYGQSAPLEVDERYLGQINPRLARSVYPLSKIEGERLVAEYAKIIGFEYSIPRLFHSFGSGMSDQDGRSFADFIWNAARGENILLRSSGDQIRTFLYLEDSITGIFTAINKFKNEAINIGSDQPCSIFDFASAVKSVSGVNLEFVENLENPEIHSPNEVIVPSISKLKESGWRQNVSLLEGITRTLQWAQKKILES